MTSLLQSKSKSIAGISIKTNNLDALNAIPALWGKFFADNVAENIPDKQSDSIYAVYTDFENEGKNNEGDYTFLIGVEVELGIAVPEGVDVTQIPDGRYHKFQVPENNPEKVIETWQAIWPKQDIGKTFKCDYEQYRGSGAISIHVGTSQQ